jgi:N-dimethylarginine dimethylaminohydrolase
MFAVSPAGSLFYYPEAFTPEDRNTIVERGGEDRCIEVSSDEALRFACNTIVIGETAISPLAPLSFAEKLARAGLRSVMVDLSEFMKAGGAAKCLVLRLNR